MSYLNPIADDIIKAIIDGRAFTRLYTSASATDFGYIIGAPSSDEIVIFGVDILAPGTISQVDFGYWSATTGFSVDTGTSVPVALKNLKQGGAAFTGTLHYDIASVAPPDAIIYHISSSGMFLPAVLRRVHNQEYQPSETLARVLMPKNFRMVCPNGAYAGVRIQNATSGANKIQLWFYIRK